MGRRSKNSSVSFRVATILGCGLALLSSVAAAPQDEIWQLEEAYWRYVKAGDVDQYIRLWHQDFAGWPCRALHPSRKANIGDWVREIRDGGIKVNYSLQREAIQYFGDVAVVHYSTPMVYEYPDGRKTGEGEVLKFTHTWMKVNGQWQIIGGMCASQKPTVR